MNTYIVKGDICFSRSMDEIVCLEQGSIVVENARVTGVFQTLPARYAALPVLDYGHRLILPGMSDLHVHAPQFAFRGLGMDMELLEWLNTYTFPEESKYQDLEYAHRAYESFVRHLVHSTTTRASIFATIHVPATLHLMELLEQSGLRTYVGKVNMNRNCPVYLREISKNQAVRDTVAWIEAAEKFEKTKPILTPRFIPSCTDDLMYALSELRRQYGLPVQSHLSENPGEIAWVAELCPGTKFYGESYSRYGLFGGGVPTVMAHCIYSPDDEAALMKQNRVMIAHCPTSNENVIAGIAPAAYYLRGGWRVGLGSDVAGGQTLDLFTVMATAVQVSKLRWRYIDQSEKPLTMVEALYMATVGGGDFWADFGEKVGLFEDGYAFDALVLDDDPLKNMRAFSAAERLERYAYLGKGKLTAKFAAGEKLL